MSPSWRRYLRIQDFVWLLLFTSLIVVARFMVRLGTDHAPSPLAAAFLVALLVVKILESRIGTILAILIELALCFGIIWDSGNIASSFYLLPLLPVISAATNFGLSGTVLSTLAACAVYLSQLVFLQIEQKRAMAEGLPVPTIYVDQYPELVLKCLWFPLVGFLTYQLAKANREKTLALEATARELATANQSLKEARPRCAARSGWLRWAQLTAGLAHELRNPLGTMKSSAELLGRQVAKENEIAKEMAGYIATEVDRTNSLITRFLDFARPQHLRLETGDITALLDSVIARFERESGAGHLGFGLQKLLARRPQGRLRRGTAGARAAEPAGERRAGQCRRLGRDGEDQGRRNRRRAGRRDRGDRPRLRHRRQASGEHLQSLLHHQVRRRRAGPGHRLQNHRRARRPDRGRERRPGEGSVFRVYLPAVREACRERVKGSNVGHPGY